jgi:gliding motility-associated-like protein
VVDANGCSSPLTRNILVINYPKFFTPNDDTFNDAWNIYGLNEQLNSRIFIFDRYGKLLKQINPSGDGWDGTFNGQPLPADDYWFSVDYEENGKSSNFKAHFSLKR